MTTARTARGSQEARAHRGRGTLAHQLSSLGSAEAPSGAPHLVCAVERACACACSRDERRVRERSCVCVSLPLVWRQPWLVGPSVFVWEGAREPPRVCARGSLCEYMGHDVSNMRGFDSYRLLTLPLAALMTRISSVVIEAAHTSAGAATLARTVPFWGRFRSPREPTAGPCRGCLLPSATNTAPSRHHLQAVLFGGWDVQTPPSWLLRPQTRELYGWS